MTNPERHLVWYSMVWYGMYGMVNLFSLLVRSGCAGYVVGGSWVIGGIENKLSFSFSLGFVNLKNGSKTSIQKKRTKYFSF